MYFKLSTKSLFAGLTEAPLVRRSITRKLLQRSGNFGRDISPTDPKSDKRQRFIARAFSRRSELCAVFCTVTRLNQELRWARQIVRAYLIVLARLGSTPRSALGLYGCFE